MADTAINTTHPATIFVFDSNLMKKTAILAAVFRRFFPKLRPRFESVDHDDPFLKLQNNYRS